MNENVSDPAVLFDANEMTFGSVPFLEHGYIINIDNEPLHNETIHGLKPRRWHIYYVENFKIIQLVGLSDKSLERLKGFMEEIKVPGEDP